MSGGARIRAAIESARANRRPALVAYLTAGFPRLDQFGPLLRATDAAADVIEVGVPFSDPMADGATIQRSSRVALEQGVTLRWILDALGGLAPHARAPILLMSYLNPLLAGGLTETIRRAAAAGVAGFIIPDLPLEESPGLRELARSHGMALVQMVTPVTPDERIRALAAATDGFLYAVTVAGITGGSAASPGEEQRIGAYLDRVRSLSGGAMTCAGFGVRSRAQVRALAPHADGVIVGSALIEAIENKQNITNFLTELVSTT
ncbi:MAG: tryptophan synthase subunit alpha [Phycisphaerae bacterium]|nr:tryptophan synthase subunit alpha [Phycisphaerae bacterium]